MDYPLAQLHAYAQRMRRSPTPMERKLWRRLRARRTGTVFRRQYVLAPFIVDFYSIEDRVVVEVDGPIHATRRRADARRTAYLRRRYGVHVVRVTNHEVCWHQARAEAKVRRAVQDARRARRRG